MIAQRLFLAVAAPVFVLALFLAAPGVTWYDGGELVAGVTSMGVTHPPGQPAYMVLGKLATLLPVGSFAFRLTLLSALAAALGAGGLAVLVGRGVARLEGMPAGIAPLPGVVAGLLLGFGPALMLQAGRPELYSLLLLLGVMAALALQTGGRRGVALAVLPLCVAGAVHHALLVAATPGIALLALGRGRGSLRAGIGTAAVLLPMGLLQFAWLPLRSFTGPALDAGIPRTLGRTVLAATGAGYARSFRLEPGQLARNLSEHWGVLQDDVGGLALGLCLLGVLVVRPRAAVAGAAFVGFGLLPTLLQGVFSAENPDAHGYLLPPIAALSAGAGLGAYWLTRRLGGWWWGTLALLLVVALPLRGSLLRADRRGMHTPERLAAAVLHDASPGALVLLGGDSWLMPAWAAHVAERRRPDVQVEGLHMLEPLALPDLAQRGRALPAALDEAARRRIEAAPPGLVPDHLLPLLLELDPPVDVLVNDFFVAPSLLAKREPFGLLLRVHRGEGAGAPPPREASSWFEVEGDAKGRDILARRDLARAGLYLQRGEGAAALGLLRRGSEMAADPWAFVRLARHRLESGADVAGPWSTDPLAMEAAGALMAGDLEGARATTDEVLRQQPTHPLALLVAERLYFLGHHIDTSAAP